MQKHYFHLGLLGLVGVSAGLTLNSAQADIRVYAGVGLGELSKKDDTDKKKPSGLDAKLAANVDVLSPVPGLSIYAGPEFLTGTYTRDTTILNSVAKETINKSALGLNAGVHFGMVPLVTFQGELNYATAMGGEVKVEALGKTSTLKTKSGSDLGGTLRALITPFPLLRAGVEYNLGSGNSKYEGNDEEVKYDYSAIRAVIGISL
ncbi:MAG: hypothetical protein FJY29_11990 [Betaproteobacteria bacterium]|nr:hypothetical protein [Betaproteobacteria bacterium]